MHSTVASYLNQNKTVWAAMKAMCEAVAELAANNEVIAKKANQQESALDGPADIKNQVRQNLINLTNEIADQLSALSAKLDNVELEAQSHVTMSLLEGMEADELRKKAQSIAELATTHLTALADYDISAEKVQALTKCADGFDTVKSAPRTAIAKRKGHTKSLAQAISDNQSLLRRQLDKQMTHFKLSQPEFFAGYRAARVVVNRRSHRKASPATPVVEPEKPAQG